MSWAPRKGPRTVYFIRPVGMRGPIKIGCSASPETRRSSLDTWSPFALEIIAKIPGGYEIERRFHALFAHQHDRREWFRWCPLFDEVVAAINGGTFETETLPPMRRITHLGRSRTPEQRLSQSFTLRCQHVSQRTGFFPPVRTYRIAERDDALGMAIIEAYLADPARGDGIDAEWARAKQQAFLSQREPRQAAA